MAELFDIHVHGDVLEVLDRGIELHIGQVVVKFNIFPYDDKNDKLVVVVLDKLVSVLSVRPDLVPKKSINYDKLLDDKQLAILRDMLWITLYEKYEDIDGVIKTIKEWLKR